MIPPNVAKMTVSPAVPDGAPRIIFAALDAGIAAELEPRFADAGCAVVSNSSALRMAADVPLVIPDVNACHVKLIETQAWRRKSGGFVVTNPNCSAIGLVLALAPLEQRFGLETVMVVTMQAVSGAGYPGVASLDILGNVIPYIAKEEEKMEEETLKLLGTLNGSKIIPGSFGMSAQCNRVAVEDGHTESVSVRLKKKAESAEIIDVLELLYSRTAKAQTSQRPRAACAVSRRQRSSPASFRRRSRRRHDHFRGTPASLQSIGLEVHRAFAQHHSRSRRRGLAQRRTSESSGVSGVSVAQACGASPRANSNGGCASKASSSAPRPASRDLRP